MCSDHFDSRCSVTSEERTTYESVFSAGSTRFIKVVSKVTKFTADVPFPSQIIEERLRRLSEGVPVAPPNTGTGLVGRRDSFEDHMYSPLPGIYENDFS